MAWGRFSLCEREGTGGEFPLVAATVTVGEAAGEWWLTVQAQTMPPDWTDLLYGDLPGFPAIEAGVRIAGPDSAAWLGREFRLPEGPDPQSGCYPAWLYTTGGYDALRECVVSVGERVGGRVTVRVATQGVASDCSIRVVGEFALVVGSAQDAEPSVRPGGHS